MLYYFMGKASRKKKTAGQHPESQTISDKKPERKGFLKNTVVHILLIIVLGLIVYSNTFDSSFHFDDKTNILENYKLRNLENFWPASGSRWFGFLSFAINYHFSGLNTSGYHLTNIVIHLLNSGLIYLLVLLIFSTPGMKDSSISGYSRYIAFFSAMLFVSHPVQTQAVTYIVQRFTSLATFFYLLSLVLYIRARFEAEIKAKFFSTSILTFYLISLLSAVLAMKTKEIAFTLPVVMLVYEICFLSRFKELKKTALLLFPFILTLLIIPLSLVGSDRPLGDLIGELREASQETEQISRPDYLFTQFRVIVTYIRLIVLPVNLNLDYDYPVYNSFFNPNVFLSFLFLLVIFAFGIYLLYSKRYTLSAARFLSFGIFWFFITLSVESSIIPISDVIFEHRLYLPSIWVFISAATGVFIIAGKMRDRIQGVEKIIVVALVLLIFVLAGVSYARNILWKDEITLWRDVVKKSPYKARGYNNLAVAYAANGFDDEAFDIYHKIISIKPDYYGAYYNIGVLEDKKGRLDEALDMYNKTIAINPDYAGAYSSRGVIYGKKGLAEKAINDFTRAVALAPGNTAAYYNRALEYIDKKQFDMAINDLSSAIAINPEFINAYYRRGMMYVLKGDAKSAISDLNKGCGMGNENACKALKAIQEKERTP